MKPLFRHHSLALVGITLSIALVALCLFAGICSTAQSATQETKELPPWQVKVVGAQHPTKRAEQVDINAQTERIIENQIPFHIPIKVELNNLDKEPLLRNLEVKVTNIGMKPIYFLELVVDLPKTISPGGNPIIFTLVYGRMEFINLDEKVQPDDVPLRPGESYVFKIPENQVGAFEKIEPGWNYSHSDIKLVYLWLAHLSFGDGTAFTGAQGTPLPNVRSNKTSSNSYQPVNNRKIAEINVTVSPPDRFTGTLFSHLSASLSSVKSSSSALKSPPLSDACCQGYTYFSCYFRKNITYSCNYCGTGNLTASASCNDAEGVCSDDARRDKRCTDSAGNSGICVQFFVDECPPPFPGCFNVFQTPSVARNQFCDYCCGESPIIIDVQGDGYNLTNAQNGVDFDLNNDAVAEHLS